jgi:hypothetical protein
MKVKLSKSADRFLKQLEPKLRTSVLSKVGILKTCLETQKVYPPEELDIKISGVSWLDSLEFALAKFELSFKSEKMPTKFLCMTLPIEEMSTIASESDSLSKS